MTPRAAEASGPPIRVLLVDDSPWQREGWATLLGSQPDLLVVGQAGDGARALTALRAQPVDVVLMDIQMTRVDGVTATSRILADAKVGALGTPRIILVTNLDLDEHVPAAAAAGAYAVLYKDVEPEALFEAIRAAAASG